MKTVLCIADGRPSSAWPAILQVLVVGGALEMRRVESLHEAVELIISPLQADICGVILDVEALTEKEILGLGRFKTQARVPIWMLPINASRKRAILAASQGVGTWETACAALARAKSTGNSVPSEPIARYDENVEPLLSQQELDALLGTSE